MDRPGGKYRILVFSWNTESISLCETMDQDLADKNRAGYFKTWTTAPCTVADFFSSFTKLISKVNPDIVVIGFQEDRKPGSYFHSDLLVEKMPALGYELVKRTRLMGVGVTTTKGMLRGELVTRGLRSSVYAKTGLVPRLLVAEDNYICSSANTRGKGALAIYLTLPEGFTLAFISCHLPFDAKSLVNERLKKNPMLRQNELNYSNICFNGIIENLVLDRLPTPTHLIYFGDFNYRINNKQPASILAREIIQRHNNLEYIHELYRSDELYQQTEKGNIYRLSEGGDGQGPTFLPTCKLVKERSIDCTFPDNMSTARANGCYSTGKLDQRVPSWCDRILYGKFNEKAAENLRCTYYDRFDTGHAMSLSDHAGVIAIFELG